MTNQNPSDERGNDLEITVLEDGRHVNVRNAVSGSGEAHTVTLEDGEAVDCTCKGQQYNNKCYHTDEVERRPLVTSAADALRTATATKQVATDGGHDEDEGPHPEEPEDDRFRLPEDPQHVEEDERGTVDVSPCLGCSSLTTGDTCGRDRCEGASEVDETPL